MFNMNRIINKFHANTRIGKRIHILYYWNENKVAHLADEENQINGHKH